MQTKVIANHTHLVLTDFSKIAKAKQFFTTYHFLIVTLIPAFINTLF